MRQPLRALLATLALVATLAAGSAPALAVSFTRAQQDFMCTLCHEALPVARSGEAYVETPRSACSSAAARPSSRSRRSWSISSDRRCWPSRRRMVSGSSSTSSRSSSSSAASRPSPSRCRGGADAPGIRRPTADRVRRRSAPRTASGSTPTWRGLFSPQRRTLHRVRRADAEQEQRLRERLTRRLRQRDPERLDRLRSAPTTLQSR